MATTAAALVLRGKGCTALRLEGRMVVLRNSAEELRIPVEAMTKVRAEGRAVEIELLGGAEPVVYRVEGVSQAGADAFEQAVMRLSEFPHLMLRGWTDLLTWIPRPQGGHGVSHPPCGPGRAAMAG